MHNLARERRYRDQARDVLGMLRDAAIDVLPYKGPFWGAELYPDYTWRYIGDLDLLMSRADAERAAALLRPRGYRPDVVGASEQDDFARRGELTWLPPRGASDLVPVQLHWEPLPAPRFLRLRALRLEDFQTDTRPGAWASIPYRIPRPEVQLLYLLLHATCQHQFMRFVHVVDLVRLLERFDGLDWGAVRTLAEARHVATPVYYGLRFVHAYWPLPAAGAALLGALRPRMRTRLVADRLSPESVLGATRRRGKQRRKLFRAAMTW